MKKSSQTGTGSIIKVILVGVLAGIIVSVLLGLLISILVFKGGIAENKIKFAIIPVQFIAAFTGSLFAGKKAGQKYAVICGGAATIYCMILLSVTVMLFDSAFQSVGLGIGMCAAGYIAACAICMTRKGNRRKRKT